MARYTQSERLESPRRGRIKDSKGRLLVGNVPLTQLMAIPSKIPQETEYLSKIASALNMPEELVKKRLNPIDRPPGWPIILRDSLKGPQLVRASILSKEFKGLYLKNGNRRTFPYGKVASHILGYVGEVTEDELKKPLFQELTWGDEVGKRGVERRYDRYLRGTKGIHREWLDVVGQTRAASRLRARSAGHDLQLTLDVELQQYAEEILAKKLKALSAKNNETGGGAMVLMEAKTGKLLVSASLPEYDPRPFTRGISVAEFTALLAQPGYPLINRVINGAYAPGSTFKMITASGALQENLCTKESSFWCSGSYLTANCFVRSGHGGIGFAGSIAHSCDVVYYQLGHKLGIKRLKKYCAMYGLGSPTGVDLPDESAGLLPDSKWKERAVGREWWGGDTINLSIGQGFLLVSPLQMAVVTAAVANGGEIVQPYFLGRVITKKGSIFYHHKPAPKRKVDVKPEHLAAIRRGMEQAVLFGTSTAAYSGNFSIAGKTGTVENAPNLDNPKGRNHTWFVSYAPADNPKVVCVAMLEQSGGYGGSQCAPLVKALLEKYFQTGQLFAQEVR